VCCLTLASLPALCGGLLLPAGCTKRLASMDAATAGSAQCPKRVLFIGDSLTYVNDLDQQVLALARAADVAEGLTIDRVVKGVCVCVRVCLNARARFSMSLERQLSTSGCQRVRGGERHARRLVCSCIGIRGRVKEARL